MDLGLLNYVVRMCDALTNLNLAEWVACTTWNPGVWGLKPTQGLCALQQKQKTLNIFF